MTEWPPPDADGKTTCPAHPEAGRFHAVREGCIGCASLGDDDLTPETTKADKLIEEHAAVEADERGLPDMLALEVLADGARKAARKEMAACRKWAGIAEDRAQSILSGDVVVHERDREGTRIEADHDDEARRWLDVAAKYRMAVEKGIDTQSKLLKMALIPAAARWRAKQMKARALLKGKGTN